jgi:hypothetical protein
MAALLVAALFWGNCLSCPQVLLTLAAHKAPHGCCHHSQPAPGKACQVHLRHFVTGDSDAGAPAAPVATIASVAAPASIAVAPVSAPVEAVYSPPLKFVLDSCFRI